jgi:hypothetical protein
MTESPELAAAKPLLDAAEDRGFTFERIAVGEDAPLGGARESTGWLDEVYVGGLFSGCSAARRRRYSLVVPRGLPVTERVSEDALEALHAVVDGRADECCAITLEAGAVTLLFDVLGEWLG